MTNEKIRSHIESLFRAYNNHDVEAILALFTEDVVFEDPNAGDGGKAAARWHAVGTMTGPDPPGYLPTGKTADWSGMCNYEFRDGLIARHQIVYDVLGLTQALGLMPGNESLMTKTLVSATNVGQRLARVIHR